MVPLDRRHAEHDEMILRQPPLCPRTRPVAGPEEIGIDEIADGKGCLAHRPDRLVVVAIAGSEVLKIGELSQHSYRLLGAVRHDDARAGEPGPAQALHHQSDEQVLRVNDVEIAPHTRPEVPAEGRLLDLVALTHSKSPTRRSSQTVW